MSTLLQFQYRLAASSPNTKSCTLLPPKNQYLFVASQILHPSDIIHAKFVLARAKGVSDDESYDEDPVPLKRPPFNWKKWGVGILFFFILPSYRLKMKPILRDKVEEILGTAEIAAEVVENLAELVEKLADEAEKRMPDNTKLNDFAEAIENLAERVDEKAEQAQELIIEIENMAEDIEEMMEAKLLEATGQDKSHDHQGTIEGLTKQAEKKAEETQELLQQVDKLGRDIKDMHSNNPATRGPENRA